MNSIVCYTCITGGYDTLKQPAVVSEGVDYICFTDSIIQNTGAWQVKQIPDELKHLSNVKKQRIVKICPHRYLREYDVSLWIDGNIYIKSDVMRFISQYNLDTYPLYTRVHPNRRCMYDEADACIEMNKGNPQAIMQQVDAYRADGYPAKAGMVETNVILRKHNDVKCQLVCNAWASELLKYTHRDQLSFNYVCWKMHFLPGILKNEFKIQANNTFMVMRHT